MTETKEISNNGWQNIGIMKQSSRKQKMNWKYRIVYMEIIEESFGYLRTSTGSESTRTWANNLGMDKMTFVRHVTWLEKNNFIQINRWTGFVPGGGSKPNTYSPAFPKNAFIKIDKITIKSTSGSGEFNKKCDIAFERMTRNKKELIAKWNKQTFNDNKSKGINKQILIYDYFKKHKDELFMYTEPESYLLKYPKSAAMLTKLNLLQKDNINEML